MDTNNDRNNSYNYSPELKKSRKSTRYDSFTEEFAFKKTRILEKHKNDFIKRVYIRKSPNLNKQLLKIKPNKYNYSFIIEKPILGNKYPHPPHSSSAIPKLKYQCKKFNKLDRLLLQNCKTY